MMLSIHSSRARIMTADLSPQGKQLRILCSDSVQFSGFSPPGQGPNDLEGSRDLFFRWINPTCHGAIELAEGKQFELIREDNRLVYTPVD